MLVYCNLLNLTLNSSNKCNFLINIFNFLFAKQFAESNRFYSEMSLIHLSSTKSPWLSPHRPPRLPMRDDDSLNYIRNARL